MGDDCIRIPLTGRIDSNNAPAVEQEIQAELAGKGPLPVILDAEGLEYISSAGLRVLLRLKKTRPELTITGVSSQVYEVLETTGFTELLTVEKAYRTVSVKGCEVIGEGFNGKVYRLDQENVVKTYKDAEALPAIRHEREVARLALILGIPTAISYDVVRVGEGYGSVFELLEARSFAKILAEEPEKLDWCVRESVALLKKLHSTQVPEGKLPRRKEVLLSAARSIRSMLPEAPGEKLERMISAIPERDTMLHGDYHTKNIMLAGEEVLLIDMDTLSTGHPIFDLAQMYNSYLGFSEYDPGVVLRFQGFDRDTALRFWQRSLEAYFGAGDAQKPAAAERRIRCAAYTLLLDWSGDVLDLDTEEGQATLALWKRELLSLLETEDSLELELPGEE
ncbi:MAG: anti-sigma factor antagonist [Oscillospiraceae bacterium]|nr:anti-sigma factor antagonist [Oscillospiraceae bacterium]